MTKIFHPNVSERGEICVNTLKKDWKENYGFKHILLTVKCLLIVPNPESSLNEEAGRLLLDHYDDYFQRAKIYTSIHAKASSLPTTGSESGATVTGPGSTVVQCSTPVKGQEEVQRSCDEDVGEKENQSNNTIPTMDTKKVVSTSKKKVNANKKRGVKRL